MAQVTLTIDDAYVAYVQKFFPSANLIQYAQGLINEKIIQDIDLRYSQEIESTTTESDKITELMALP